MSGLLPVYHGTQSLWSATSGEEYAFAKKAVDQFVGLSPSRGPAAYETHAGRVAEAQTKCNATLVNVGAALRGGLS
jgi:hypothetical protein